MRDQRDDGDRIRVAHKVLDVEAVKVPMLDCACDFQVRAVVPKTGQ